ISLQNNLKNLKLSAYEEISWSDIIPALTRHPNTLTKLHLYGEHNYLPLSFIPSFSNLQEIALVFYDSIFYEDFKELQHVIFPKLKILNIPYCPIANLMHVLKFLENNGKNLE